MSAPYTTPFQAPPSWHKDYKISGQIGEPGQKEHLAFSSLARQKEHGLSKGFPKVEIVDSMIRAIAPGMQLCGYLEGKNNLDTTHTETNSQVPLSGKKRNRPV